MLWGVKSNVWYLTTLLFFLLYYAGLIGRWSSGQWPPQKSAAINPNSAPLSPVPMNACLSVVTQVWAKWYEVQIDTRLKTKISICMLCCFCNFHLSGKLSKMLSLGVTYCLQTDHHLIQQRKHWISWTSLHVCACCSHPKPYLPHQMKL